MAVAPLVGILISAAISGASAGIQYLIASKRKIPPTERGRNDDIRLTGSDYGSILPRVWGTVRLAPQLIYSTGIRPVVTTTQERTGGGKGGGGRTQTVNTYNYYTSVFLAACANEVDSIPRIWANSDVIYNLQPDPNLHYYEGEDGTRSGGATITADAGCSSGNKVTGIGSGGKLTFSSLPNPIVPTDTTTNTYTLLTVYYKTTTDKTMYVSVDGGTPVAYSFPASGTDVQTKVIYLDGVHPDSLEFSNAGASAPDIDRISVWYSYTNIIPQDIPVTGIYDEYVGYPLEETYPYSKYNYRPTPNGTTGTSTFQAVNTAGTRIYLGTETQTADSAIIADLDVRYGTGQGQYYASAHRGIAGVMLEDYQLQNGNLPNFTMEVNQGTTDVGTIIQDLYAIKDIDSSLVDVSALSGLTLTGLVVYQLSTPQSIVELLENWFNFKMVEQDGVIKACLRNQAPIATITSDDLRATMQGETMPDFDAIISPIPENTLPKEVWVSHLDPTQGIDYKNNAQPAKLHGSTLAEDVINLSFPFVASPQEAKDVAETQLLSAHTRNKIVENLSLMPKFAKYTPCDTLTLQLDVADVDFEITKKTYIAGSKVEIEGLTTDEIDILTDVNVVRNQPDVLLGNAKFPANTELLVFESVPVDLTHEGLGVYVATCQKGVGKWTGCALYNRINTADDWIFTRSIADASYIGVAQDILGDHSGTGEDTTNTVEIYFYNDVTLETVTSTDLSMNPQRNLIRIGDEWVQFKTATVSTVPTGSTFRSAWIIEDFQRGKFSTDGAKALHGSDEVCCLYTNAVQFVTLDSTYQDSTINFIAPTFGQSQDVASNKSITLDGLSTGGVAPTDLVERIGNTDLTLTQDTSATNTAVTLRIQGYSESVRFRKIFVSSNSDMSSATLDPIQDANLLGGTLPSTYDFTKSSETSAVHRYFRVEQSVNGIDYRQVSNVLDVTFASSGGSGGSGTLTQPAISLVITTEDDHTADVEITATSAGSGSGNYKVERSSNSGISWSVVSSSTTLPATDTVFKLRYPRTYYYRIIRANNSSLYSDAVAIEVAEDPTI